MNQYDMLINNRYQCVYLIGKGGYGAVYLGKDIHTKENVAIKLEQKKYFQMPSPLFLEYNLYKRLQTYEGFPKILHFDAAHPKYTILIMELLGPTLSRIFKFSEKKFDLKTVLMLADQLLRRLEVLHSHRIIHRDLKPNNIVMGLGSNSNVVHIIDLGSAYEKHTADSYYMRGNVFPLKTPPLYASISNHKNQAPSYQDDLETLGYILIHFLKGTLPWELGVPKGRPGKLQGTIFQKKLATSIETLCDGLPEEFFLYFDVIRNLHTNEVPNYKYLREIFHTAATKENLQVSPIDFGWSYKYYVSDTAQQKERKINILIY